jgi:hypothetical protein
VKKRTCVLSRPARSIMVDELFAIGSVLAPKRGQKRSVFCDHYTV